MHYEYIGSLEVTYGHALAGGGGFRRVTTPEGNAAELTPATFLWFKSTSTSTTNAAVAAISDKTTALPLAIVDLHIDGEAPARFPVEAPTKGGKWIRMDKPIDRARALYVWYLAVHWRGPQPANKTTEGDVGVDQLRPLKEIRVVRDVKDLPDGFCCVEAPPLVSETTDAAGKKHKLRSFVCYKRLDDDDLSESTWTLASQRVGVWIDVRDLASNRWRVGQVVSVSASECRISVATWSKKSSSSYREEVVAFAMSRSRAAPLGTHTALYLSPSYPMCRKQGGQWNLTLRDVENARLEFDQQFFTTDNAVLRQYLKQRLMPLVEKSMLSLLISSDLAEQVNVFHQHVVKNIVVWFAGRNVNAREDASVSGSNTEGSRSQSHSVVAATVAADDDPSDGVVRWLLSILRLVLSGMTAPSAGLFFYLKYGGSYATMKAPQHLVFTSYLTSSESLINVPTRHPCRSTLYVDVVDVFLQAGGFRLMLERVGRREVSLVEVAVLAMVLLSMKPCLALPQKRKRSSSSSLAAAATGRRKSSAPTENQQVVEDFFREFLQAALARLRRMQGDELRDEDGVVEHIIGVLDAVYRDGTFLGGDDGLSASGQGSLSAASETYANDSSSSSSSSISAEFVAAEVFEMFHLDLAKKFICCPFLAQRLLGVARLSDVIAMAQRRDALQKKSSFNSLKRTAAGAAAAAAASSLGLVSSLTGSSSATSISSDVIGSTSTTKWLRSKFILEWLLDSDVIEVILGQAEACKKYGIREGIHLELLKRSRPILEAVTQSGHLTETHLSLIWKAAMSQLRTGRKTLLELLISLCDDLSADLLDIVMVLLTQVAVDDYDELVLQFIQKLVEIASRNAMEAESGAKKSTITSMVGANSKRTQSAQKEAEVMSKIVTLGLSLMWNAIEHKNLDSQQRDSSPATFTSQVAVAFAESLNHVHQAWASTTSSSSSAKELQQLLSQYVVKCVGIIKAGGQSTEMAMAIVQKVVENYGRGRSLSAASASSTLAMARSTFQGSLIGASSTPRDFVKDLETKHSVIALIVDEVERTVTRGHSNHGLEETKNADICIGGLQRRLSFLAFVVTSSELELAYKHVERLWRCFVGPHTSASGVEDSDQDRLQDVFFHWLSSIIADPAEFLHRAYAGKHALSPTTTEELFTDLTRSATATSNSRAVQLDIPRMTSSAFVAFERLFRFVNVSHRRLSCESSSSSGSVNDTSQFTVESMDLKGLETVYEIALRGRRDVSDAAINYLVHIHLRVGSKLVKREVWTEFALGCVSRLAKANASDGSSTAAEAEETCRRILVLLNTLLYQSIQEKSSPSSGDSSNTLEALTVYVRTQDGRSAAPFYFTLKRTCLVGELRDLIARESDHSADCVRLINDVKIKLTAHGHDRLTLEKALVVRRAVHVSTLSSSRAVAAVAMTPEKQKNCVEAVLLNRPDSDTIGHVQRSVAIGTENGTVTEMNNWDAVKFELSSGKILHTLQQFLAHSVSVSEEAWKLLKQLNYDSAMEKKIRSLDDVVTIDGSIRAKVPSSSSSLNWAALLDVSCPPKLLYQLELLEKFAMNATLPGAVQSGSSASCDTWSESFVALGGLAHLKNFVLSLDSQQLVAEGGSLAIMCVTRVFQLLHHFIIVGQNAEQQQQCTVDGDIEQLVIKVLEMIRCMQSTTSKSIKESPRGSTAREPPNLATPTYVRPGLDVADQVDNSTCSATNETLLTVSALRLLSTCVIAHGEANADTATATALLQSVSDTSSLLIACLVRSSDESVRKEALRTMSDLCTPTRGKATVNPFQCRKFFLSLLASCEEPTAFPEYYELYTHLIQGRFDRDGRDQDPDDLAWFDFLAACVKLCRRIVDFPVAAAAAVAPRVASPGSALKKAASPAKQKAKKDVAPDAVYELLLSTLLAVVKKIPPILANVAGTAGKESRSLREVVVTTINTQEGIIQELFTHGLFPADATSSSCEKNDDDDKRSAQYYLKQPKCKSDSCRQIAFELLRELALESAEGLHYLFVQMAGHHSLVPPQDPSTKHVAAAPASVKKKQRSSTVKALGNHGLERGKYVGLKNLGCTCYLNSTIQAFFMIPRFRRQILRYASQSNGLVYELQSVFAHLEGSAKAYYNPKALTMAMKTWEGEPIDVNEQQDASEFLTSFFQQIESEMNGRVDASDISDAITSAASVGRADESILNAFFGGVFSNELVAEGDRYSERFEPFHFISVPVRDRKNLLESLDGWAEGDKVSYTWESPAKEDGGESEKVTLDTHKRISIQKLPDQLVIHLKRFEFDFEAMQQIKIHDRFEFPTELDMYPYTKEGQEELRRQAQRQDAGGRNANGVSTETNRPRAPEYYEYELVGTVVHMGSAHSGHYYSFLRDHDTGKPVVESESNHNQQQWYEFNDTHVTPFDAADIPDECFGGQNDGDGDETPAMRRRKKTRSSFMLFYSRRQPKVESKVVHSTTVKSLAVVGLVLTFLARLKTRARGRLEYLRSRSHVLAPEPIQELILLENRMFWRKKYLFNRQYLDFTFQLVAECMGEPTSDGTISYEGPVDVRLEALQLATKFVFGTLWQSGDVAAILQWKPALCALYRDDVRGSEWLLTILRDSEALLLELLVSNEHSDVRELTAIVLEEAIMTTSHTAAAEIAENHSAATATASASPAKSSRRRRSSATALPPSFEFMFLLFRLMPWLLTVPQRQHRQYFEVLLSFALSGQNECTFAVVNSVVGAIVALLTGLGSTQPLLRGELDRVKGRTILKRLELDFVALKLLSLLIRSVPPLDMDVESVLLPSSMASNANVPSLPVGDHDVVLSDRFVTLLTQHATHYTRSTKPLEQIVMHLSWQSKRTTSKFMATISHGIESEDHDDIRAYFRTFSTLLKIKDSLMHERLDDGMTTLVAIMASQQKFYKATEVAMDMLTRIAKRHPRVEQWVRQHQSSCVWMDKWLRGHRGMDGYLQQGRTSLVKPNSTSSWVSVSVQSDSLVRSLDRTIAKLYPRIQSLLDATKPFDTFYDSDDNPMRLVGKRVRVKWAKEKWYEGVVERFDERSYEHLVEYDDGDKRQYRMSDKIFYIVEPVGGEGDEQSGLASSRRRESSSVDL